MKGSWFDKNKIWKKNWADDEISRPEYQNGFGPITNGIAQGVVILYLIGLAVVLALHFLGGYEF